MKGWRIVSIVCVLAVLLSAACTSQRPLSPLDKFKQVVADGNPMTMFEFLAPLAKGGDPYAQMLLGKYYLTGEDSEEDLKAAKYWFRKAADGGLSYLGVLLKLVEKNGWPASANEEFEMWLEEAKKGSAAAQFMVGHFYWSGRGVHVHRRFIPIDYVRAEKWLRRAASAGVAQAMESLASMYITGQGVVRNYVRAVAWRELALVRLVPGLLRDGLFHDLHAAKNQLSAYGRTLAREYARELEAQIAANIAAAEPATGLVGTGTGFFVSREGHLLTNNHVVDGCDRMVTSSGGHSVTVAVVATDKVNDLALLKFPRTVAHAAAFRDRPGIRPADTVLVIGYPLHGILTSGAQVTVGTVSALAGPNDDVTLIQISAPVQPGNSGGPLLDRGGHVVGVVVARLDAIALAAAGAGIPQNVNFGIKGSVARNFLEANGVPYLSAETDTLYAEADVAEAATAYTVLVECWVD